MPAWAPVTRLQQLSHLYTSLIYGIPMLLVDVTYILNSGKVKVRVINMQALPIQCVLTLWIQIVVMVHVYCVGSHMYRPTTDCDISFLVFQCTPLQLSPLRRIQHIFCRYSQSLMHSYDYFLSSGTNRVDCTGAALVGNVSQHFYL